MNFVGLREAEHTESLILYNMLWPTNPNPYSLKAFCMQCFCFANIRHIFHTNVSDIFHCATFSYIPVIKYFGFGSVKLD